MSTAEAKTYRTSTNVPDLVGISASGTWGRYEYRPIQNALAEVLLDLPSIIMAQLRERGLPVEEVVLRFEECKWGPEHVVPPTLVQQLSSKTGWSEARLVG